VRPLMQEKTRFFIFQYLEMGLRLEPQLPDDLFGLGETRSRLARLRLDLLVVQPEGIQFLAVRPAAFCEVFTMRLRGSRQLPFKLCHGNLEKVFLSCPLCNGPLLLTFHLRELRPEFL